MPEEQQAIKFDSGSGWAVEKLSFIPQFGISAEAMFAGKKQAKDLGQIVERFLAEWISGRMVRRWRDTE